MLALFNNHQLKTNNFIMKKSLTLIVMLCFAVATFAQSAAETEAIIAPIKQLFDAMRAGDSTKLRDAFLPDARLMTAYTDKEGIPKVQIETVDNFAKSIGTPHDQVYDEKIWSYDVTLDGNLASVWTEYTFYLGEQQLHCGVNAFQVAKTEKGWKIIHITDTRRKTNCQTQEGELPVILNAFLDNWHRAAAKADEDAFFGSMTEDGVYIGTDATEYWKRDEMKVWAKEFFDRETAWDFKPLERHLYFSGDKQLAWFDENLDTWMGICRGSGVLQKTPQGWRIKQYVLSVTVPNESIDGFLKLIGKK